MMKHTVTLMTRVTRNKIRLEIDDDADHSMVLSEKEICVYGLKEGEEIPEAVWEQLRTELVHKAVQKSGALLMNMDYSRQGLISRLIRSGFSEDIAVLAAGKMEEAGYINDQRLASGYIRYHIHDRSLQRIRQDLLQKGIPEQLLDEQIRQFTQEATETEDAADINGMEQEQIRRLLDKRGFSLETADYTQMQKTIAFLLRKGYRLDNIHAAMRDS